MGIYTDKAVELSKGGYPCSQAVAYAFAEKLGADAEKLKAEAIIYRGGRKKICGAVMGARCVINYLNGIKNSEDPALESPETAELIAEVSRRFIEKNTTELCAELKGNKIRSCVGCVEDAAAILEQMINEGKV